MLPAFVKGLPIDLAALCIQTGFFRPESHIPDLLFMHTMNQIKASKAIAYIRQDMAN